MAALLILQFAVDEGLGALFFGIPTERIDDVRRSFAIPESHDPIGATRSVTSPRTRAYPAHRSVDDGAPTSLVHRGGSTGNRPYSPRHAPPWVCHTPTVPTVDTLRFQHPPCIADRHAWADRPHH